MTMQAFRLRFAQAQTGAGGRGSLPGKAMRSKLVNEHKLGGHLGRGGAIVMTLAERATGSGKLLRFRLSNPFARLGK
jgi:hypothetical protein